MEESCRKCAPKASPKLIFILVNNPKKPFYLRTSIKNKIF